MERIGNDYAKYTTIEDIIKGGYGKQNVRILGTLVDSDPANRVITIESRGNSLDVEVSENSFSNLSVGGYIQVYGTVILGSSKPKIIAKFVRSMNGVDEAAYNFAVDMYRKLMPSQ